MPTTKTKKLAAQLGLLGSKRKATEQGNSSRKKKKKGQLLSFIIVIDFESTCWQNKKGKQEIIEFPAILLNLHTGNIESEFHQYVLPEENPLLSDFCKQLTGITQDQVNSDGVPLRTCLYLFSQWIEKLKEEKEFMLMEPGQVYDENMTLCAFVTWTDWDFGVCLHYECHRKQIRKPHYFNQWIDVRALYKTFYDRRPCGLNGALEDLGITFDGRQHSGIDDARNTAKLCYRMVRDGCKFNITKCIQQQVHTAIIKPFSMAESDSLVSTANGTTNSLPTDLHEKDSCSESSSPTDQPSKNAVESSSPKLNLANEDWNDSVDDEFMKDVIKELDSGCGISSVSSHAVATSDNLAENSSCLPDQVARTTTLFQKPFTKNTFSVIHDQTPRRTECISHIAPITLLSHGTTTHQDSIQSAERTSKIYRQNISNKKAFTALCTTPVKYQSSVSSKIPSSPLKTEYSSASTCSTFKEETNNGVFRTPSTSEWIRLKSQSSNYSSLRTKTTPQNSSTDNVILANSAKVTPPLCSCGRRTKRKTVCAPGPNEGKPFFVCPNSSGSSKKQGCGYFKWECNLLSIPQEMSPNNFKVMESEYFE